LDWAKRTGAPFRASHLAALRRGRPSRGGALHLRPGEAAIEGEFWQASDGDAVAANAASGIFYNSGQTCNAPSRIIVDAKIADEFTKLVAKHAASWEAGDPLNTATSMGSVIDEKHMGRILGYVDIGKNEGAELVTGGTRALTQSGGFYVAPTVLANVRNHMRVAQEEIFGPVVVTIPFETEEEARALANATRYGLAASVWTENISRAHRVAAALESGIVWINCWLLRDLRTPFGGVKDSGVGREGGFEALQFFTEPQNVCVKL
jgi:aminomuconate-semialdehyde/2-hydroxymuconate-6-semialdehyde dehydrogenase